MYVIAILPIEEPNSSTVYVSPYKLLTVTSSQDNLNKDALSQNGFDMKVLQRLSLRVRPIKMLTKSKAVPQAKADSVMTILCVIMVWEGVRRKCLNNTLNITDIALRWWL